MIPATSSLSPENAMDGRIPSSRDVLDALAMNTGKKCQSRHEIIQELRNLGVNTEALNPLSMEGLSSLLDGFHVLINTYTQAKRAGRPRMNPANIPVLTNTDKAIVRYLFESKGQVSSLKMSRELDIPLSTIQRRRKRLQDILIETNYSLKSEKLGWRNASLYVSSTSGRTEVIGKEILDMSELVSSVTRTVGDSSFDLKVDMIFKTIEDLTTLIDKIKSMEGVSAVIWSESLKLIGRNETGKKVIDAC
jgi:DNA-binding Lrp family transcriptional regulator